MLPLTRNPRPVQDNWFQLLLSVDPCSDPIPCISKVPPLVGNKVAAHPVATTLSAAKPISLR